VLGTIGIGLALWLLWPETPPQQGPGSAPNANNQTRMVLEKPTVPSPGNAKSLLPPDQPPTSNCAPGDWCLMPDIKHSWKDFPAERDHAPEVRDLVIDCDQRWPSGTPVQVRAPDHDEVRFIRPGARKPGPRIPAFVVGDLLEVETHNCPDEIAGGSVELVRIAWENLRIEEHAVPITIRQDVGGFAGDAKAYIELLPEHHQVLDLEVVDVTVLLQEPFECPPDGIQLKMPLHAYALCVAGNCTEAFRLIDDRRAFGHEVFHVADEIGWTNSIVTLGDRERPSVRIAARAGASLNMSIGSYAGNIQLPSAD
jgi:hypothetical protein